ncbi:hypothetical protein NQ318_012210 [Aromia moschata]|uniref:Uncharacterized protein n=1 Tax=Aromia moschata TaxID=1265417 RepID=A0AAV8YL67_9CUCU|nr:hypothetical protein NQ318_012210 [Aromia moschata]
MDRNKLCRLCSARPQISYSLLERNGANILEALTGIKIEKNDNLPKRVCLKCWLNLKLAYQIQQNILEIDKTFRLRYEEECDRKTPSPRREAAPTLEAFEEALEDPDTDAQEYNSIKVENLTEDEVLVIYQTDTKNSELTDVSVDGEACAEGPTVCHICGDQVEHADFMEHLKKHFCSRLQCEECNTYCEKHRLLPEAHEAVKRDCQRLFTFDEYKYDCPYCKRKFKSEEKSLLHIKTHNKKECPICHVKITPNFKVHNPTSLRSHIYYTHSTRKYSCKYCKKVFKKSYDLPLHIKKEHTGQRDHVCDICGKGFFTFHTLNTHTKMTHMKLRPFQCQYCKKKFSSKHSLTTHERQHTNITPYTCEMCGEGFRQNVSLRAHKKSKHNIVEEKTCACKVCGKSSARSGPCSATCGYTSTLGKRARKRSVSKKKNANRGLSTGIRTSQY